MNLDSLEVRDKFIFVDDIIKHKMNNPPVYTVKNIGKVDDKVVRVVFFNGYLFSEDICFESNNLNSKVCRILV